MERGQWLMWPFDRQLNRFQFSFEIIKYTLYSISSSLLLLSLLPSSSLSLSLQSSYNRLSNSGGALLSSYTSLSASSSSSPLPLLLIRHGIIDYPLEDVSENRCVPCLYIKRWHRNACISSNLCCWAVAGRMLVCSCLCCQLGWSRWMWVFLGTSPSHHIQANISPPSSLEGQPAKGPILHGENVTPWFAGGCCVFLVWMENDNFYIR